MAISALILFPHSACSKKKESSPRTKGKFVDSFLRHTTLAHIPSVAGGKFSIERIAALPCAGKPIVISL